MSLSVKRSAYSDMPSFSSQSAICCMAQSPRDRASDGIRISQQTIPAIFGRLRLVIRRALQDLHESRTQTGHSVFAMC